jgi:SAM-dependent methyltransferase
VAPLRIPAAALPLILLQRIDLQRGGANVAKRSRFAKFLHRLYERSNVMKALYRWVTLRLSPIISRRAIHSGYQAHMQRELGELKAFLPKSAKRIMDIGCGVGGMDLMLYKHFEEQGQQPHLLLVDKTGISRDIFYGFHDEAAVYNSLEVTEEFLQSNGVPEDRIRMIDSDALATGVSQQTIPAVDLVVSTWAWGFHFPVTAYAGTVHKLMRPGARLILDVRDATDGMETLEQHFADISIITTGCDRKRVCATKAG